MQHTVTLSFGRWIDPHLRETEGIELYMMELRLELKVFWPQICGFPTRALKQSLCSWVHVGLSSLGSALFKAQWWVQGSWTVLVLQRLFWAGFSCIHCHQRQSERGEIAEPSALGAQLKRCLRWAINGKIVGRFPQLVREPWEKADLAKPSLLRCAHNWVAVVCFFLNQTLKTD